MVRVQAVAPGSLGAALGLVPGTELHAVNGRALEDFLDWEFLSADEQFVLSATLPGGDAVEYDVERPEGLPLGVALEAPRIRRCANHCDFCFVDGNPAGMRAPLYIRDDDYRLSFRYGNFATLTNLKPWDVARRAPWPSGVFPGATARMTCTCRRESRCRRPSGTATSSNARTAWARCAISRRRSRRRGTGCRISPGRASAS